jgi:selenocysteine lyase/cysteine desulfurase
VPDVLEPAAVGRLDLEGAVLDIEEAGEALTEVVEDLGADAVVTLGHKWLHGPLATGGFWVRDLALFGPTRLGWRSRLELPTGSRDYNPNATRFETGTVDAAAFVGLRQTLVVHRLLGSWVSERVRSLRRRLLERIAELPFTVRSMPEAPTGIVVVEPKGGDVATLVQRMWDEERIVVKLIDEPGIAPAIRISFWALHKEKDIDRLAAAFARTLSVGVR